MSIEFYRESPGKFGSRTLNRKTLDRWTGRTAVFLFTIPETSIGSLDTSQISRWSHIYIYIYTYIYIYMVLYIYMIITNIIIINVICNMILEP